MITPSQTLWHHHKRTLYTVLFVFLYSVSLSYAVPPTTKYAPGSTLDPLCTPGSTNCSVRILPEQSGNTNTYLTTDGSDTAWSTSTLILGGNFQTSGAYATTLTTTGTTALTLPTSGTLYGTAASSITSSQLLDSLSDETGTGLSVFNTAPSFTTSIATPSILTASGALTLTPASGSNVNINLATTGDFAVNTNQLYVDTSTGNVGIGTTTPEARLDIQRSASGDNLRLIGAGATDYSDMVFYATNNTTRLGYIDWSNTQARLNVEAAIPFVLSTNATVRLTIDASGNLIASDLAGTGNRCLYADSTGQINVKGFDCGSASGGDNLGDHVATQNITLGSNWLSGDGGAEGIRISSTGDVGIQTASPAAALNVTGTSMFGTSAWPTTSIGQSGNRVLITDTSTPILTLNNANATVAADNGSSILLGARATTATNDSAYVRLFGGKENATSGNYSSYLAISTLNGTDGTQFERMRIAANGNVGIGATAPATKLDFGVGSANVAQILNLYTGANSPNLRMGFGMDAANSGMRIYAPQVSGTGIAFGGIANTGAQTWTEYMRVDTNTGNVGIGTTGPSYPLDVSKSVSSSYAAHIGNTNTTAGTSYGLFINGGTNNSDYALNINNAANSVGLFTVTGAGNVGLGTAAPGAKLALQSTAAAVTSLLLANNNNGTGDYNQIKFQYSQTDPTYGVGIRQIIKTSNIHGGNLAFLTDNTSGVLTERMRIDESGNVGIGTASPDLPLTLHYPYTKTDTTRRSVAGFVSNESANGFGLIMSSIGAATDANRTFSLQTQTQGLTNGGNLVLQDNGGNVGIGTTAPASILHLAQSTSGGDTSLHIQNTNGTALNGAALTFGVTSLGTNTVMGKIAVIRTNTPSAADTDLAFSTYNTNALVERMRIVSSGNVGIGTTDPGSYRLNIQKNDSLAVRIQSTGGTDNAYINFLNLAGGAAIGLNGAAGQLLTGSADGALAISNYTGQPIHISADSGQVASEGMTIVEDGRVGIGTIAPSHKLDLVSNGSTLINMGANRDVSGYAESGLIFEMNGTSIWEYYIESGTPSTLRWYNYQAAAQVMSLNSSGNLTVVSLTQTSDQRLKDNIASIDQSVMANLLALRPVTYNMNTGNTDLVRAGFIAQEVEQIFPDLIEVGDDENNTLSLNYIGLIPYMVKGIQEMNIKIQALPEFEDDDSMATAVADFLRGIANGIASIGEVQTSKLCVDDICVTRDQFLNMVESSGQEPTPEPTPEPIPEPAPDPVVEPEPTPEPVPEPEPTPEPAP